MKLDFECYPCLMKQALKMAKLIDLNEEDTRKGLNGTMEILLRADDDYTAPFVASKFHDYIQEKHYNGETFDPYREIKRETNNIALSHYDFLAEKVRASDSPLERAVRTAAVGNIIDFGAKGINEVDIDREIDDIDSLEFGIFDFNVFFEMLAGARSLLYIGDNAGEIVFDKILISEIRRQYGDIDITFATRGRPILNDITPADAEMTGMGNLATVISSGSRYPGTVLRETSGEFRRIYDSADLIIAKGQGNYETLSEEYSPKLFFLMRVKCDVVSRRIKAPNGSLVLMQNIQF